MQWFNLATNWLLFPISGHLYLVHMASRKAAPGGRSTWLNLAYDSMESNCDHLLVPSCGLPSRKSISYLQLAFPETHAPDKLGTDNHS